MTEEQIKAVLEHVVGKTADQFWWYSVLITTLATILGLFASYLASYMAERGKRRVTKEDFEGLKRELTEQTKATESVKASVEAIRWIGQSEIDHRKDQLQKLYGPLDMLRYASEQTQVNLYNNQPHRTQTFLDEMSRTEIRQIAEFLATAKNTMLENCHLAESEEAFALFGRGIIAFADWSHRFLKPADNPQSGGIPGPLKTIWPDDLSNHVGRMNKELRERLDKLHSHYAFRVGRA